MQKLRFLLADCSRRGARLWVLMNADMVASELRVILGSVATALDVLPADVVGASVEAGELARLLSQQAWRAPVWPDEDDGRATRSVRSMLALFRSRATPHAEDAMMVLGRVGITSWCDCAEEAAFLEAELLDRLEDGRENDNDLVLISGLMAFLVYCRVVLFDTVDAKKADAAAPGSRPASSCAAWTSQEALQCPISLELMTDPVTVTTGQTYDRTSIKRWIKSGCRTCPVTGEKLRSTQFVPNPAGATAILASSELVTSLVDFLGASVSRSGKDHCVALLASLCLHGGDKVVALMGKMTALMPALYALIADGSPLANKKARWLINEIHRVYEQRQPTPPVALPAGDRVIRV
ncbi:U-box domain-containing protein 18 [Triticum urartu]|uniref:RING-type E3 ubiquitin transferase n=1 Tax=Triticum urartu TaxID=4572 RepID=M8A8L4_TRIUA|nr:U-box domain-containing protein 18 [Triticum urartu]